MKEQDEMGKTPVSGREARRRFLRSSSGVAVAVPAAVLLLSASRVNAQVSPYADTSLPPPR